MTEQEKKDKEIKIGENKLYLSEENILYDTIVGDMTDEVAIATRDATYKLMDDVEGKLNVLIDINQTGKPSKKARNIFKEFLGHEKWGKVAIFGMHPVARMVATFGIGVSNKKDVRFFKTKEEALVWLKVDEL